MLPGRITNAIPRLSRPMGLPLCRGAGVHLVGRAHAQGMRGPIVRRAPADLGAWCVRLLEPDPAQPLQGRALAESCWSGGRVARAPELEAVPSTRDRPLLAVCGRRGEPSVFQAVPRAVTPVRGALGLEPVGGHGGEVRQRLSSRLADPGAPLEHADGSQDVRGVRALPTPGVQQALRAYTREEGSKEDVLGGPRDQTGTQCAHHRGSKARVREGQRQGLLPLDAAPDVVGRLAIGEPFATLEHRDEREAGRSERRLPQRGTQRGTVSGLQDRPQGIADAHHTLALWKDRLRDTGSLSRDRRTHKGET